MKYKNINCYKPSKNKYKNTNCYTSTLTSTSTKTKNKSNIDSRISLKNKLIMPYKNEFNMSNIISSVTVSIGPKQYLCTCNTINKCTQIYNKKPSITFICNEIVYKDIIDENKITQILLENNINNDIASDYYKNKEKYENYPEIKKLYLLLKTKYINEKIEEVNNQYFENSIEPLDDEYRYLYLEKNNFDVETFQLEYNSNFNTLYDFIHYFYNIYKREECGKCTCSHQKLYENIQDIYYGKWIDLWNEFAGK